MRWLVACGLLCGCTASFVGNVRAEQLEGGDEVAVSVEDDVEFSRDGLVMGLRIANRTRSTVVFHSARVIAQAGAWNHRLGGLGVITIAPEHERVIAFPMQAPHAAEITLVFDDAFEAHGVPLRVGALRLRGPIEQMRNSPFSVTLRAVGGVAFGRTIDRPLAPAAWVPQGALGGVELGLGYSSRWVELAATGRAGRGRLAGVELGLHPGLPFLTAKVGYALDLFGHDGSKDDQFGHGPRFSVEALFDVGDAPFASKQPRTFGFFALGGWTTTIARAPTPSSVFLVFELGLMWRLR